MDVELEDLTPHISDLTTNISALETALSPLLNPPLPTTASKLPLLDQAKLYTLATYSLESLLFCSLRLSGVDAKEHAVFKELARVRQYFAKIKAAETTGGAGAGKRNATLDKEAAGRFIKQGLAGNERFDAQRAERVAREKAGAKRKLEELAVGTHTRFDGAAKRMRTDEERRAGEGDEGEGDVSVAGGATEGDEQQDGAEEETSMSERPQKSYKAKRNEGKRRRKAAKVEREIIDDADSSVEVRKYDGSGAETGDGGGATTSADGNHSASEKTAGKRAKKKKMRSSKEKRESEG